MLTFPLFCKNSLCPCICAFFLLYLRTPPVGRQFLSRYARTNFPTFPRNYGRMMQPILLAFGNRIALTADPVSSRATDASALPTHSRSSWGPHSISLFQKSVCPIIPPYCLLASELTVSNKAE